MSQLPWDLLDVISQKLDFDDLLRFACVCTNWRDFHKSNFMASQEPLLVEFSPTQGPSSFSILTNQKVYPLDKMMTHSNSTMYVTYSSGYFITVQSNNSFMLFNPFTRIGKVIYASTFQVNYSDYDKHRALLAFEKCSEEFALVVLCKDQPGSLHVYRSRKNAWFTYSAAGKILVDFVVLHNMIYVVTDRARIGVLKLNSGNIKFLKLKNTSRVRLTLLKHDKTNPFINLVNCDENLIVVDLTPGACKLIYKIDLSSMSYVPSKSLGGIALFYIWGGSCTALSSPNRWGYKSNCLYQFFGFFPHIIEYNWDKSSKNYIHLPGPEKTLLNHLDRCFRHLKYQLDYSLLD
ncbi:uncharacterized protein LOC131626215 [Vicia villosa]|uniref:uncharacterized protein LOC131626215 n=1 Tax=Vicia villosa TaxID=3911 RepID=UPI00273C68A8|nr:uncharacterized protein LOC131626215 [Vicia villosa]